MKTLVKSTQVLIDSAKRKINLSLLVTNILADTQIKAGEIKTKFSTKEQYEIR